MQGRNQLHVWFSKEMQTKKRLHFWFAKDMQGQNPSLCKNKSRRPFGLQNVFIYQTRPVALLACKEMQLQILSHFGLAQNAQANPVIEKEQDVAGRTFFDISGRFCLVGFGLPSNFKDIYLAIHGHSRQVVFFRRCGIFLISIFHDNILSYSSTVGEGFMCASPIPYLSCKTCDSRSPYPFPRLSILSSSKQIQVLLQTAEPTLNQVQYFKNYLKRCFLQRGQRVASNTHSLAALNLEIPLPMFTMYGPNSLQGTAR